MNSENTQIAAIDLGSNSFHMVIAQLEHGEVRIQEQLGEKVQLAAGIQKNGKLCDETIQRALACLERFGQRLRSVDRDMIQIVGTNALRVAKNRKVFLEQVEDLLGIEIEVISGREEARLIYLGVAHTLADDEGRRLVIDIGGGSTEFIIGRRFEADQLESLHMGCVSFRERFFPDGSITKENLARAIAYAERELLPIKKQYKQIGWQQCVGASGSIKAIFQALGEDGTLAERISFDDLKKLKQRMVSLGDVKALADLGIKKERLSIFPAGFAILYAAFNTLGIQSLEYTSGALREGLLYDMLGRIAHEDVRDRTIQALQQRYAVDVDHAAYVEQLAMQLLLDVKEDASLAYVKWSTLTRWAAKVFEIGLSIAHSQYHKHGAYLVRHSDLPGFSNAVQSQLAFLIRSHRRKIPHAELEEFSSKDQKHLKHLMIILRLAIILAADREQKPLPAKLSVRKEGWSLKFESGWLEQHPLTAANLDLERYYLKKIGFDFSYL